MMNTRNCPNCGAPVEHWQCDYCGTMFHGEGKAREIRVPPSRMAIYTEPSSSLAVYPSAFGVRAERMANPLFIIDGEGDVSFGGF